MYGDGMLDCPNNGWCGSKQHQVGSLSFQKCLNDAKKGVTPNSSLAYQPEVSSLAIPNVAMIEKRLNSDELHRLRDLRDKSESLFREIKDRTDGRSWKARSPRTSEEYSFATHAERTKEAHKAYLKTLQSKVDYEEYKNETARQIMEWCNVHHRDIWDIDFEEETFGDAEKIAYYPSGSPEWLRTRQSGIGGSDVYDIVFGNDKAYEEKLQSKLKTFTENDDQNDVERPWAGWTGRGNAWEPYLVYRYKQDHDVETWYCKDSWKKGILNGNLDGLCREAGSNEWTGLECKTSSKPEEWADGAIPVHYRAQALHYMHVLGIKKFTFIADLDNDEIVYRDIYADEPVDPDNPETTYKEYVLPRLKDFWDEVEELREKPENSEPDFSRYQEKKGIDRWPSVRDELATLVGVDKEKVRAWVPARDKGYEYQRVLAMGLDPDRDVVFVATNGTWIKPVFSETTEVGAVRIRDGEIVETYQRTFKPAKERFAYAKATGAINYNPEIYAPGYASSVLEEDTKEHRELQRVLCDDDPIVVHLGDENSVRRLSAEIGAPVGGEDSRFDMTQVMMARDDLYTNSLSELNYSFGQDIDKPEHSTLDTAMRMKDGLLAEIERLKDKFPVG